MHDEQKINTEQENCPGTADAMNHALQQERNARQKAEDELKNIFELSPDMMCVVDYEAACFLKVNPAFSNVLGYSEAEFLSRSFLDFIHPDDLDATKRILTERLAKGMPVFSAVNRYVRKDGSCRWLEWNSRPQPERGRAYAIARDITERRQIEDSLRLSEETFRAVLNAITEAAYLIDTHGFVLEHNQTFAVHVGRTGEILRGKLLFDLLPMEDIQRRRVRINEVIKTKKGLRMEDESNGRFISLSMYPICDSDGDVAKIAVFGQDITWLRQAQETLLLNEERLESLLHLSQMTHESEAEIREHAVEEAVSLTRSKFGYLHFVNEDRGSTDLLLWSREAAHQCSREALLHNPAAMSSGIWTDSFRQRRPIIHNDMGADFLINGFPEGHPPVTRHLSVPVFDHKRIVAIAGVCNKPVPYDETDIAQLGLFMHTMWAILMQRQAEEVLKRCSIEDALTGVANRRHFDNVYEAEWRRASREKQPLTVLFMDIDFFKAYNDVYGHQAGDECLKRVAGCLRGVLQRLGDMIARYGGEEFVAILPNTEIAGAIKIAETMREKLIEMQLPHEDSSIAPYLTISVGAATGKPKEAAASDVLLESADRALYQAKNEGRNRVRWCVVEFQ
ncbi:MAG: GAF sensor-containing diguanylate cyclase [Nitrospirae bacterium]|nr:MAG: GAF sensor-containing diguanylate cyclase [Nitrospirota bacterium]